MEEADSELTALKIVLGEDLEARGWVPDDPLAVPFGAPLHERMIALADHYLREIGPKVHPVLCNGSEVKPAIDHGSDIVAAVADAISGLVIPAVTVANILCKMGLRHFCRVGHSPSSTPTP